jgi:hypothetical protein
MMRRRLNKLTRIATWLAWASFALRVLVPVGYMPAAIADGGPFVLCPGGYQAELLQYLGSSAAHDHGAAAHAGHASAEHGSHAEGSDCSIGATFAAVAPTASPPVVAPAPRVTRPVTLIEAAASSVPDQRYHSRAPPLSRLA